jgi:hypothetical protein
MLRQMHLAEASLLSFGGSCFPESPKIVISSYDASTDSPLSIDTVMCAVVAGDVSHITLFQWQHRTENDGLDAGEHRNGADQCIPALVCC